MKNTFVDIVEETARMQFKIYETENKIAKMKQWVHESAAPESLKIAVLATIGKLEERLMEEISLIDVMKN